MRKLFLLLMIGFLSGVSAYACDSSQCTLSREAVGSSTSDSKVFTDFSVEQMNWDTLDPREAHTLHHQGHHVHDKTHEEFYHFTLGVSPIDRLTILAELPYVVRGSVEIESHARLGNHESSEGWGDLSLNGVWRFVQEDSVVLGWLVGVKLPTGETKELNSAGERFEPELQPGTGSTDGTLGLVGQKEFDWASVRANVRYTWKGKSEQDFRFGNAFDAHLSAERLLNPAGPFQTRLGVDMEWKVEAKQSESGEQMEDSGGNTVLAGPTLEIREAGWTIFGNILLPVVQNLGGVHQELDFVWNAGAKIQW